MFKQKNMCILPIFKEADLEAFKKNKNRGARKDESETEEFLIAEQQLKNEI
jgi:hypothetical protein